MSKSKKILLISLGAIAVFALVVAGLWFLLRTTAPKTYSTAKEECENFLNRYQAEMEQIATEALQSEQECSGEFRKHFYRSYKDGYVSFDIDAQGMLGGQYWELVYTKDGKFGTETETFLHTEPNGNNIVRAEKINDHWWYHWTDYDGTKRSYQ